VLSSSSTAAVLSRRDRLLIPACIVLITLLAWAYLIQLDRQNAAGMEHDEMMAAMGMNMEMPWTTGTVLLTFAMWAVMMAGMMMPSALPLLMLFAAARTGRDKGGVPVATLMFGFGYLVVWTAFSAGAALAQWGLHQAALLSEAMKSSNAYLSGAILIAAGIYQLTPWKSRCLSQCRSPLGFLMTNWRDGATGALRMGLRHGTWCLGCCWAVMCVLFVVGVMNLVWVAALAAFVLIEKLGPAGAVVARVAGAGMVVLGIAALA
jgi:predicted metal-binding membrane protein